MSDVVPSTIKFDREEFLRTQARHSKRCLFEARVVGVIITICMISTSTYMALNGYVAPENRPATPDLIGGIPSWVVWGLFVPWLIMIVITWCFALFVLKDDEPIVEQVCGEYSGCTEM